MLNIDQPKAGVVETVGGQILISQLGPTLSHEHIRTVDQALACNYPHVLSDERVFAEARSELTRIQASGFRTIIDPTTVDRGRDVLLMRSLAIASGVQVVAATGVHLDPPIFFKHAGAEFVSQLFIRDLCEGIGETGIRAAFIKVASEDSLVTTVAAESFRAAAIAHAATGAPLWTHSSPTTGSGVAQQDLLQEFGADLSKVVVGHSGDTTDLDYLRSIMDRGSCVGLDRFGLTSVYQESLPSDEDRVGVVVHLAKEGYSDRMLLSHDRVMIPDFSPWVRRMAAASPNWRGDYLGTVILPRLRERGVTNPQIREMTQGNIARLFSGGT